MRRLLSIILFISLFTSVNTFSQSKFNLSFYGGYSLPLADLEGDFPDTNSTGILDFNKSSSLLTSSGFNIGTIFKYAVDTTGNARITAGLNYNSFTGSQDYSRITGSITYKNKVNIFSISAGLEYSFLPKKKINPFLGLDLAANFYSGNIDISGDTTRNIQRKSESRFGAVVNGGTVVRMSQSIDIVIGLKYALTNLIGKKATTTTALPVMDAENEGSSSAGEIPLNDEETSSNKSKALYYLQFYAGFSFDLGNVLK